ncbi:MULTISPECIES: hypothetical protein [Actinomadura]|uniref:Uncharacterized protein n=1 Tax=Actinomadura yumaensis TaxID=111807 RepID=A0ABW2CQB2_9ACTN|nr:hypothetical protein [Actinomadura sp. J1-007]MWK36677.1 hypothetical protein [Actinomadura sp. J1-007]
MRENEPRSGALWRMLRGLQRGLMYVGANAWPTAEVYAALRAASAESAAAAARRRDHRRLPPPDVITAYADLAPDERDLLLHLEEQFKRENEK